MRASSGNGINVGSSSVLVIFVILCITTFATLSLVSANADNRLTQKTAQSVQEYYEADAQAQETLAEIDAALHSVWSAEYDVLHYPKVVSAVTSAVDGASVTQDENGASVEFEVAMGESRKLVVALAVLYPVTAEGPFFERRVWQVVSTMEYPEDGGTELEMWDGDSDFSLFIADDSN